MRTGTCRLCGKPGVKIVAFGLCRNCYQDKYRHGGEEGANYKNVARGRSQIETGLLTLGLHPSRIRHWITTIAETDSPALLEYLTVELPPPEKEEDEILRSIAEQHGPQVAAHVERALKDGSATVLHNNPPEIPPTAADAAAAEDDDILNDGFRTTLISWTDHTWNPWRGCEKITPGCENCYMFTAQRRYGRDPAVVVRTQTWDNPLKWYAEAEAAQKARFVFTCSWSDFFIEAADAWRQEAWDLIRSTPWLTYQILTKRPNNIADRLPADWGNGYPNAWLGVSVESKAYLWRLKAIAKIPAALRFASVEPLLEDVCPDINGYLDGIGWMIVGGESGPGYRPMDTEWARRLRDLCGLRKLPFFFKQSAAPVTETGTDIDGVTYHDIPSPYQPMIAPEPTPDPPSAANAAEAEKLTAEEYIAALPVECHRVPPSPDLWDVSGACCLTVKQLEECPDPLELVPGKVYPVLRLQGGYHFKPQPLVFVGHRLHPQNWPHTDGKTRHKFIHMWDFNPVGGYKGKQKSKFPVMKASRILRNEPTEPTPAPEPQDNAKEIITLKKRIARAEKRLADAVATQHTARINEKRRDIRDMQEELSKIDPNTPAPPNWELMKREKVIRSRAQKLAMNIKLEFHDEDAPAKTWDHEGHFTAKNGKQVYFNAGEDEGTDGIAQTVWDKEVAFFTPACRKHVQEKPENKKLSVDEIEELARDEASQMTEPAYEWAANEAMTVLMQRVMTAYEELKTPSAPKK